MTIIDRIYHDADLPEAARGFARETVTLGWEDRLQGHGRRQTDSGREIALSLPRGTVLRGGDCLILTDERTIVEVVEQPEAVFLVEPRSPFEWALFAYQIGNRHQPLMVTDRGLVCP